MENKHGMGVNDVEGFSGAVQKVGEVAPMPMMC